MTCCLISLMNGKMKLKTAGFFTFSFLPSRLAKIKNFVNVSKHIEEGRREKGSHVTGGHVNWYCHFGGQFVSTY